MFYRLKGYSIGTLHWNHGEFFNVRSSYPALRPSKILGARTGLLIIESLPASHRLVNRQAGLWDSFIIGF